MDGNTGASAAAAQRWVRFRMPSHPWIGIRVWAVCPCGHGLALKGLPSCFHQADLAGVSGPVPRMSDDKRPKRRGGRETVALKRVSCETKAATVLGRNDACGWRRP